MTTTLLLARVNALVERPEDGERVWMSALLPVDDSDREAVSKIAPGEIVKCIIKHERNIRFHRLYWKLLEIVWQNIDNDHWPRVENLHESIKLAVGLREEIYLLPGTPLEGDQVVGPEGATAFKAGSIAFANMDETEFSRFFDRVCDLIAKTVLPHLEVPELVRQVEIMTGIRKWWE